MENKRVEELQHFANDFDRRLLLSENKIISEQNVLFRKINNQQRRRNSNRQFISVSNTPIRNRIGFQLVTITIIIII